VGWPRPGERITADVSSAREGSIKTLVAATLPPSGVPRKPDAAAPVPAFGCARGSWAVAVEAAEGRVSGTATGSLPVVVEVVVDVATVGADVVTGTDGPDAVTVATDVVTPTVVLGTVTGTVAAGVVTVEPVGTVTVAVGVVTVAIEVVTVVPIGTVTACVVTGVESVTVGSPIPPSRLPASTFAPKKPATARQTKVMTTPRVRSGPRPTLAVRPQWARFSPLLRRYLHVRTTPKTWYPLKCRKKYVSALQVAGRPGTDKHLYWREAGFF
jgi:hypothetical protein